MIGKIRQREGLKKEKGKKREGRSRTRQMEMRDNQEKHEWRGDNPEC